MNLMKKKFKGKIIERLENDNSIIRRLYACIKDNKIIYIADNII